MHEMVYIKLKSICIFIISTIITTIGSNRCPPNAPFLCLPYEACCNYTQFCYSGQCESCFPDNVNSGNSSILFEWCQKFGQYNVALMKNETCRYACHDMFREKLNSPCPQERPFQCLPDQACCNYSEYCNAGKCESCFPDNLSTSLLEWCQIYGQHNATLMKNETCQFACQDMFTAEELNPHCPQERPFQCLPHQACCNYSEYCNAGKCESCFPDNLSTSLLDWCQTYGQYNATLMKKKTCQFACQERFTADELNPYDVAGTDWMTPFLSVTCIAIALAILSVAYLSREKISHQFSTCKKKNNADNLAPDQTHSAGRPFQTFETESHIRTKSELRSSNPDLCKVEIEMDNLNKMPDGGPDKYNDTIKDKRYDKKDHQPEELVPLDFQAKPEVDPQETRN